MKKAEDPIDKQVRETESQILIASIPADSYTEEVEAALVDVLEIYIKQRAKKTALRRLRL